MRALADEFVRISRQIRELEAKEKSLRQKLLDYMLIEGTGSLYVEGGRLYLARNPSQKIIAHDIEEVYRTLGPEYLSPNSSRIFSLLDREPEKVLPLIERGVLSFAEPERLWRLVLKLSGEEPDAGGNET